MRCPYKVLIGIGGWYFGWWIIKPPTFDPSHYLCIGTYYYNNVLENGTQKKELEIEYPKRSFIKRKTSGLQPT